VRRAYWSGADRGGRQPEGGRAGALDHVRRPRRRPSSSRRPACSQPPGPAGGDGDAPLRTRRRPGGLPRNRRPVRRRSRCSSSPDEETTRARTPGPRRVSRRPRRWRGSRRRSARARPGRCR
jgi:hypothetical protein